MLRARHLLVAVAALCGCSKGPSDGGNPPSITQLTREQHTSRFFPIASGPHAVECNACHGTSSTFREFDCLSCHAPLPTNSRHKGMPRYGYDSASCYGCHRDGRAGVDVDHSSFFPVATGQVHALGAPAAHVAGTIGCASCHTNPAERTQIDCTSCHSQTAMAPLHLAVPDLKFTTANETSALCVKCHSDSAVPIAVANHAPFQVSSGSIHYQKPCLTCHAEPRTDKAWAQDFKQQACIACHDQPVDRVVSKHEVLQINAVPADVRSCLGCHPSGEPATNFDHVFFPIAAADVHALGAPAVHLAGSIACRSCHTSGESTTVDCTSCHNPADQVARHSGLIGLEPGSGPPIWSGTGAAPGGATASCLLCHGLGGLQRVATHAQATAQPAGFPIASGNHFQSCEQCHTATKTDPSLTNPQLDFAAASCANCHSQAKDSTNSKHAAFGVDLATMPATTATCLGCHSNGGMATSFSHPSFPTTSTDIHALGAPALHVPGAIRCESCHIAAASLDYAPVDCTTCHTQPPMAPLHVAVADLTFTTATETSGLCLKCHAESQVPIAVATTPPDHVPPVAQHAPFDVSSSAIHYQKPCLTCHATARTDKPWAQDFRERACIGCHAEPLDRVVSRHATIQISVISADTASCLACHPNGGPSSFNHPLFPITQTDVHALGLPAVHLPGAIACTSCHTGAAGPAGIDCTTCHTQAATEPAHVAVADLKFTTATETSGLCLRCHAESQVPVAVATTPPTHVPPVAPHAPFDVRTGAIHFQQPCLSCHAAPRMDKAWAADFKQQACSGCHSEAVDQVVSRHALLQITAVPTDTASCLSCHPNGEPATSFNHIFFPVALGDVHALGAAAVHLPGAISCKSCHTTGASISVDCTVCHGPADQNAMHSGLVGPEPANGTSLWSGSGAAPGGETANCLLCHANSALQRVATHAQTTAQPAGFPIANGNHFQSCEQCHTARTTAPALRNPQLDFTAASCANCHSEAKDSTSSKHAAFGVDLATMPATTATCLGCHSNGGMATTFSHPAFPTAPTDIHALGAPALHVPGTIRCESCHSAAANLDYAPIDCTTCHSQPAMAPLHVAVVDLTFTTATETSGLCVKCHAESQVPIAVTTTPPDHVPPVALHSPFNVSLGALHYQKPCLTCHAAARTDKPWAEDFTQNACIGCHSEAADLVVTKHASLLISVIPSDTASCLGCHPNGGAANFDHPLFPITQTDVHALGGPAVHVPGTIGCTSCHTSSTDRTKLDCTTCHTRTAMEPAHVAVSDLAFTTPNETSALCIKCHAEAQVPIAVATTPPDHVPAVASHAPFDVTSGAVHYRKPCLTCHAVARTDKPWAQDFTQQACIACHSEATDQVVSRHAAFQIAVTPTDTASCLTCHPSGGPTRNFNHPFFPIAQTDVHAQGAPAVHVPGTIACTSCHTTAEAAKVDCTVCHDPADQAAKHSGFVAAAPGNATPLWSGTGPAPGGETANCLLCHANAALQRVATHAVSVTQPAGFPIATGNHFQSCEQCHTALKADPLLVNPSLDFAAANCANCHSQARDSITARHAGLGIDLTTLPATTATCLTCHSNGGMAPNFAHGFFPVAATDIHAIGSNHVDGAIRCASCHPAAVNGDYTRLDCVTCHAEPATAPLHVAVADLQFTTVDETSALCVRCHAESQVPTAVATTPADHVPPVSNHVPFNVTEGAMHYRKPCLTCHAVARTDKPFAQDFSQQACAGCHSENTDQVVSRHASFQITVVASDTASCLSCHPNGEPATNFNHPFFPITQTDVHALGAPAVLLPGSIGCDSCHTTGDSSRVDCTVCHDSNDQISRHDGLIGPEPGNREPLWSGIGAAPGGGTETCLLCHAMGELQRVATHAQTPEQVSGFPIAIGNHFQSCEQCHTARKTDPRLKNAELDFAAANCANCHTQELDSLNTKHAAFDVDLTILPATTATCLACHASGETFAGFSHPGFPVAAMEVHALGTPAMWVDGVINCASCHTPATNGDYKKADCTICHTPVAMTPIHWALSDLPETYDVPDTATFATSTLCLKCHADATVPVSILTTLPDHVPAVSPHEPFLITGDAPHYKQSCFGCHVGSRTDKPWAVDFARPCQCTGCHTEPTTSANHLDSSWPGYPGVYSYIDAACISCHGTGDMGPFDHDPSFPIRASDVHDSAVAPCLSCHTNPASLAVLSTISCIGCHSNTPSSVDSGGVDSRHKAPAIPVTEINGYNFDSLSCLECHAGTITTPSWINPLKLPLAEHDARCSSGENAFSITSGNHSVSQVSCFTCHTAMNATMKTWGVDWEQASCTPCHTNMTPPACR